MTADDDAKELQDKIRNILSELRSCEAALIRRDFDRAYNDLALAIMKLKRLAP